MDTMNNDKIQPSKLDIILEKKRNLDATIQECEIRIDAKLTSLVDDGFVSKEMSPELFETTIQDSSYQPSDHFLSGIDITDDDALDQAVLNSRPFEKRSSQLAFNGDLLSSQTSRHYETIPSRPSVNEDDDDDELPTLSKILGRTTPYADDVTETLPDPEIALETAESTRLNDIDEKITNSQLSAADKPETVSGNVFETKNITIQPELEKTNDLQNQPPSLPSEDQINKKTKLVELDKKKKPNVSPNKPKQTNTRKKDSKPTIKKPSLASMVPPLVFFFMGLIAFGAFLIFATSDFNFIDYTVVFILFTCLIFTIAMPYGASVFFMILLLCSYVVLSFISVLYLEIPFQLYQIGWLVVIPMVLLSSALLIKKIKELFHFKKHLEQQIASYDNLEESPGLTIEKAYYKDLKYAMDRASRGETILTLEMITVCHLDELKSMHGSRLWDEILYKTLKIIKNHCYSTHLIYILDGSVFSILMENTSVKNQLLINQEITDAFHVLIKQYEMIDVDVCLDIASLPYTRDITNPFDYRALVLRHFKK
ncbi:putative membrane protein [Acetobacterium woodii DSM 1030]|uniref:Putative membrane protein n=2 Tax=Acetobacterium woodii TaxID=33952 RepID=H6LKG9_ACEWD|nr:putative membrane protein [Acetobacterium woodii DSM 1030]